MSYLTFNWYQNIANSRIGYRVMPQAQREIIWKCIINRSGQLCYHTVTRPFHSSTEWLLPVLISLRFRQQHEWETGAFPLWPCSSLRLYPGLTPHMWANLSPKAWVSGPVAARAMGLQHICNSIIHARTKRNRITQVWITKQTDRAKCMPTGTDTPAPVDRLKSIRWLIEHYRSETAYGKMKEEWVR